MVKRICNARTLVHFIRGCSFRPFQQCDDDEEIQASKALLMPPKRGRRSYEPEARDDMFTDSASDEDNAAWTPRGSRMKSASGSGKGRKRSRSVGPTDKPSTPLLVTHTPKRGNRARSATPGGSSSKSGVSTRGPAPFERLPLPNPPNPFSSSSPPPSRLVLFGSNALGQLGLGIEGLKQGLPPMPQPEPHPWFEAVADESEKSEARDWALEQVACGGELPRALQILLPGFVVCCC